jgi:hypothetical protein
MVPLDAAGTCLVLHRPAGVRVTDSHCSRGPATDPVIGERPIQRHPGPGRPGVTSRDPYRSNRKRRVALRATEARAARRLRAAAPDPIDPNALIDLLEETA